MEDHPLTTCLIIFFILLLVGCGIAACSGVVTINSGYVGAVRVFGKLQNDTLAPGLTFVTPFVTNVERVDTRQVSENGKQQCFTSDLQNTEIDYVVRYSLPADKVIEILKTYSGDIYGRIIQPKMNEVLEQIAPAYSAANIIQSREKIRKDALDKLRSSVGNIVKIDDVVIPNINLSHEVEHAIEQKMIQQQQAEAKEFELQKAKKDAEIRIVAAEAEAKSITIQGQALASVPQMVSLEIVKKWNGIAPATVVVGGGANPVLPLISK